MKKTVTDPVSYFWSFVNKDGQNGCWLWEGRYTNCGYGRFTAQGKYYSAHRFSYEMEYGPIEDGMIILHLCDNPPCVNPEHLRQGTDADNMKDMVKKGRHPWKDASNAPIYRAILAKILGESEIRIGLVEFKRMLTSPMRITIAQEGGQIVIMAQGQPGGVPAGRDVRRGAPPNGG